MTSKKTIFITGAGAGIGAETARLFVSNGWHVGASDINQQALDKLVDELGEGNISAYPADVSDPAATEQALESLCRIQQWPPGCRLCQCWCFVYGAERRHHPSAEKTTGRRQCH